MENKKTKTKKKFGVKLDFFCWIVKKNILFGIVNGAKFGHRNRAIESPEFLQHMENSKNLPPVILICCALIVSL